MKRFEQIADHIFDGVILIGILAFFAAAIAMISKSGWAAIAYESEILTIVLAAILSAGTGLCMALIFIHLKKNNK